MKLLESMREIERTGSPANVRKARYHGLVGVRARDGGDTNDIDGNTNDIDGGDTNDIDGNANVAADRRWTRAMTAANSWVSGEDYELGTARLFQL